MREEKEVESVIDVDEDDDDDQKLQCFFHSGSIQFLADSRADHGTADAAADHAEQVGPDVFLTAVKDAGFS